MVLVSGLKSNHWGQCTDGKPHFFKPQELPQQPVVVGIIVLHLHPVLRSLPERFDPRAEEIWCDERTVCYITGL